MENEGVVCDVCDCAHNVACNKCNLPEIRITEQCAGCGQTVETPHFCKDYQEK